MEGIEWVKDIVDGGVEGVEWVKDIVGGESRVDGEDGRYRVVDEMNGIEGWRGWRA